MSLWVNRIGQLAVLAVALFFYSCVEDVNLIGVKNPNSKFDLKYIEIPLDSSFVFIGDSIFTTNTYSTNETNRFLVGVYDDPKFGRVKSVGYTEYYPTTKPTFLSSAAFDSLEIFLQFDYYVYGDNGVTPERYYIHELTESMPTSGASYYNNATIPYNPTPIGIKDTTISYTYFQEQAAKATGKDTLTIRTRLADDFGQRIFDFIKANSISSKYDSLALLFFKGIAIVPDDNNKKIVGITPNGVAETSTSPVVYSKMVMHYHDTTQRSMNFIFSRLVGFSNIEADRSSSPELSGHPKYSGFKPSDNLLYNQSGSAVITGINFGNFYDFADTIPNMIINSGELILDGITPDNSFKEIQAFNLHVLDNNLRFKQSKNHQDTLDLALYRVNANQYTMSPVEPTFTVWNDSNTPLYLPLSDNAYRAHCALFLQELFTKETNKTRFRNFGLIPISPQRGKSVNRTVINQNNIKLRIYYTVPTVKN